MSLAGLLGRGFGALEAVVIPAVAAGSFGVDWLNGVAGLVVRATGVLTRLGEPTIALALANRFAWDFQEASDGEDVREDRPFFVICEHGIRFSWSGTDELHPSGRVRIYFTDTAKHPHNHLLSKTDFCDFWYGMLSYLALYQGKTIAGVTPATAHPSFRTIEEVERPHRTVRRRTHDEEDPADFWEAAADVIFRVNEE